MKKYGNKPATDNVHKSIKQEHGTKIIPITRLTIHQPDFFGLSLSIKSAVYSSLNDNVEVLSLE